MSESKKLVLFDVDGTLTVPRNVEFVHHFRKSHSKWSTNSENSINTPRLAV